MNTFHEVDGEIVPSYNGVNQPVYPRGAKQDTEIPHDAPFAAAPIAEVVSIETAQPEAPTDEDVAAHPAAAIIGHKAHIITLPPEEINPSRQLPASYKAVRAALPKSDTEAHDRVIDDANKLQARRFFKSQQ